jgi:hypothetical protein
MTTEICQTGNAFTMAPCSACSNNTGRAAQVNGREHASLIICSGCGALLGRCYRGDSPVRMFFSQDPAPEEVRYFDLDLLDSSGLDRVHGWYNPADMMVVQFG